MVQFKIIRLFVNHFVSQVISVQCKRIKLPRISLDTILHFFKVTNLRIIRYTTWQIRYPLRCRLHITIIAPFHENIMEQFHLRTSNFLRFYQTIDESYFRHPYIMVHLSFVIPMKNCVKRLFLFAKKWWNSLLVSLLCTALISLFLSDGFGQLILISLAKWNHSCWSVNLWHDF